MNHDQPRDFAKLRRNLRKATVWTFLEHTVSYIIVLTIVSFIYTFIDNTFSFNLGFVIVGSVVLGLLRGILLYSSGSSAIQSEEVVSILSQY